MRSYQSLHAWRHAHALAIATLRACEQNTQPRTWAIAHQLTRAVVSIEANIVEGYALRSPALLRRHLRIALGSAAEAECLLRDARELEYFEKTTSEALEELADATIGTLVGLLRKGPGGGA